LHRSPSRMRTIIDITTTFYAKLLYYPLFLEK
jgi:hypothetical protein